MATVFSILLQANAIFSIFCILEGLIIIFFDIFEILFLRRINDSSFRLLVPTSTNISCCKLSNFPLPTCFAFYEAATSG